MNLTFLLIIAFGGAFLTYFSGWISPRVRDSFAVMVSLALVTLIALLYGKFSSETTYFRFLDLPLILRLNALSWFFAITISFIGALCIIFSLSYIKERERANFYYLMMLLVNAAMLGIVLSGDLVSFYIFWEIMSWSTFLLISYNRGPALAAGLKYIIMSIIGSVTMLAGIISFYVTYGTLDISEIASLIASASSGYILLVLILFCTAFGIKNAVLPFHTWLPDAHSEAPAPFSAVLSGILIKIGTYGLLLTMYVIVGLKIFLGIGSGLLNFHFIFATLGAITIIVPTFIALLQNDAKRLLAWSSIGQVGYIILGIAFGTSLSVAGGIFHFFNHAAFKALLFLTMGAVEYQTKTRDLNSLGGLIKKMPLTFTAALIGICGLIGVPLTNGFVSKWMIYKTLILEGHPLLAFTALIGTWGTILYCYKLIHNVFLGQLPEKYKNVEKSPFSMQLPMIVLSLAILLFGILPGIPLKLINKIVISFGFESLNVTLWGIASDTGALNTINIATAIVAAGIIVWILFRMGAQSVPVSQDDSYAAGAYVPEDKYSYTVNFYSPLYRMITPYLRDVVDELYYWIAGRVQWMCDGIRRIYTGDVRSYVLYIVFFSSLLIFIQLWWNIW